MIECISDNITSPLGWTTNENFEHVKRGDTRLKRYDRLWGLPESFVGSMFDDGAIEARFAAISPDGDAYTRFEKLAILSIREAIDRLSFSVINAKTVLILSTTKANVELLDPDQQPNILANGLLSVRLHNKSIAFSAFTPPQWLFPTPAFRVSRLRL